VRPPASAARSLAAHDDGAAAARAARGAQALAIRALPGSACGPHHARLRGSINHLVSALLACSARTPSRCAQLQRDDLSSPAASRRWRPGATWARAGPRCCCARWPPAATRLRPPTWPRACSPGCRRAPAGSPLWRPRQALPVAAWQGPVAGRCAASLQARWPLLHTRSAALRRARACTLHGHAALTLSALGLQAGAAGGPGADAGAYWAATMCQLAAGRVGAAVRLCAAGHSCSALGHYTLGALQGGAAPGQAPGAGRGAEEASAAPEAGGHAPRGAGAAAAAAQDAPATLEVRVEGCSGAGAAVVLLALLAELAARRLAGGGGGGGGGGGVCPNLCIQSGAPSALLGLVYSVCPSEGAG